MLGVNVSLFTDADVYAGTEAHLHTLAHALRAEGVSVSIICPSPSPLAAKAAAVQIDVIPIQKRGLVDWAAVRTLSGLLKSGRINILHTHNGRTQLNAVLAIAMAGTGRCIATHHFIEPDYTRLHGPKAAVYRQAHHWVNRRTEHFIAVSKAVKQSMVARGEAGADKISVVYNGIHTPDPDTLGSPEDLRAELNVPYGAPLIVCTARLEREKDVASLIAAMSSVVRRFPAAQCVIVGEGSEWQACSKLIQSADMAKSVRLLGFRADALAIMNAADVFVLPSVAEPFGLVLVEAMALARPVIATRAGGPLEIVVDGETGLLVPPSCPIELAEAILRLLCNPEGARLMGEMGRARFDAHFTAVQMARSTREVYTGTFV